MIHRSKSQKKKRHEDFCQTTPGHCNIPKNTDSKLDVVYDGKIVGHIGNMPRNKMPANVTVADIKKIKDIKGKSLTTKNIKNASVSTLKFTQNEALNKKIFEIAGSVLNSRKIEGILTDKSGYIIDGHHRAGAAKLIVAYGAKPPQISIIKVNAPIKYILESLYKNPKIKYFEFGEF